MSLISPASSSERPVTETVMPGVHLLIDFWGMRHLGDVAHIETTMRAAAAACGATVLKVMLHSFGETGGVTGVALLAESHISIHTWPELDYAALDVFVCGGCEAEQALGVLRREFAPAREQVISRQRGLG
jgi:S-adenosylmethionine decarboxylase